MEPILDKFLRYVSYDTTSDYNSKTQPSTSKQFALLEQLVKELKELGVSDASCDENGYVMGSIPSNVSSEVPPIGFIAHVDTSPDVSGANIKPQIFPNYNGGDITISAEKGLFLKVEEFPELLKYKGNTIITTDGTTLLGADDKAGVAAIMSAVEHIMGNPDFKHGPIKIGFTPDEEIGRGVDRFDVTKFGAKYAYTVDGGEIGELEYENFNAAAAKIKIQGRNIHPGYAKGKMLNSILIGTELISLLPVEQRPEFTEGYEGFFHVTSFTGSVEEAVIEYIIRDHDFKKFDEKKAMLSECVEFINKKYGKGTLTLTLKDQYFNMKKEVEPYYFLVEYAMKAMKDAGVTPKVVPIRGGTDGARLSYMGLPCPNIFAGGHNFHGKLEYLPLESMQKASEVILNIISNFSKG